MVFIPVTFGSGYLTCWFTDLFQFRQRSLVERTLWSIPCSIAVSTTIAVGLTWLISLSVAAVLFYADAVLFVIIVYWEWWQLKRDRKRWLIGWKPLGTKAAILFVGAAVLGILSLVDFQRDHELFMSMTIYDHAPRVSWTNSVLHTGVPPANPLFQYQHPAPMRNYYFWYVICAAVIRMSNVSGRAALIASCVWAGMALVSLIGLYLKHFLCSREHLRRQFLAAVLLLTVCGLDIWVHAWNILVFHVALFDRPGVWPQINPWYVTLSLAPHHIASLVCCMFAFLLAWLAGGKDRRSITQAIALQAIACAGAVGLSVYVAFAFFLIMVAWGVWQVVFLRRYRVPFILTSGGVAAAALISPYIFSLAHATSGIQGSAPFALSVRETFPPENLLATAMFQHIATLHPILVRNLANLVLLTPGLTIELGFYLAILIIYLIPGLHGRARLGPERETLVFIAGISILISSFLRSQVLSYNDFGFRCALFAQFSLLLLGSEIIMGLAGREVAFSKPDVPARLPQLIPYPMRSITALCLVFGVASTLYYATLFRFIAPLIEAKHKRVFHDPVAGNLSHDAYISYFGYQQLNAVIPPDAIVQFNPSYHNEYWTALNLVVINHQTATTYDRPWCGAEVGGDPNGCLVMGPEVASIYKDASADQARSTCRQFGIHFLVATIYDSVWNDKQSWVWTLAPVVQDPEFRALDCRR